MFYDKLFSSLDFTLPRAATGRRGFPKEAMVCAFIVMKCEGFTQITDLMDYLDNNRIIAHYCGFNIMEPLPSYWTYDRCLRQLNNGALKSIMANLVRKLYELGVVDASFVGLDSTPVTANTKQNNPKSFAKNKFSKENHPKSDPQGCTKYKTIPTDYRLSIDRECLRFKRIYALRTECERYNSRFKASGQERLWVRNGNSAANLNTLAHISALAVALAAVLHGSHSYRSAKQLRRSA